MVDMFDDLKAKLASGALPPGGRLRPADFQDDYGCSANAVRDVLMRLSSFGLVEFQLQRGFRATESTLERRNDVARFRLLLEREGAARSIARGDVGWEAELTAAHHKLLHIERQIEAAGDHAPFARHWTAAEAAFHETLISACGSPIHIETFNRIYLQFRQQIIGQPRDFGGNAFETIIAEHQAIVGAALARDAGACGQAIHDHLKRNFLPDA